MSDENEKTDKTLIAEDNKSKVDLTETGEAVLDDGKSPAPIKNDPFAGRKLLFNKSKSVREDRIAKEKEQHPDVANITDALDHEMDQGSSKNELDRGDHFDTNRERIERREPVQREASLNESERVNAEGVADLPERVKVKVLGLEFEVPRDDVDEAGGLVAYQKLRAADERLRIAAATEASNRADRAKLDADRLALEQQRASAGTASTAAPASIPRDDAGNEADADAIVADLYSGDPKRAREAIAKLQARPQPNKVDPEEVARRAAELIQSSAAPAPAQPVDAKPIDPRIDELNAYMAENFGDILADSALRTKTLDEFNRLKALPENQHRRLTDIGRQAARSVKDETPHPRQEVVDRKRQLPPAISGTVSHAPVVEAPKSKSGFVEQMRRARGLPY